MKHSFAATNPCHVYDLALALWESGMLDCYYSGYPRWQLKPPSGFPLKARSWRTVVTYAMQRLPEKLRLEDALMFRWQDRGFDRAISGVLEGSGFIHGLPGQCLEIFQQSRSNGLIPVLNHASGPLEQQRRLVAPEYERAGLDMEKLSPLPVAYEERLAQESELAAVHCVASTVVRDQLIAAGVASESIWVVPYGADERLFRKREHTPSGNFKICFAGRQSLRKGIHYLLKALESTSSREWELHCFGMEYAESSADFDRYRGRAKILQRGSVSQPELAQEFQEMDVLVLPSAEEAFGLVVVQALEAGVPCIVSDRVGAKDLIRDGETGSIVPFGDIEGIATALEYWSANRVTVADKFPWQECAQKLLLQGNGFQAH